MIALAEARRLPPMYLHYMYRGIILLGVGRPADARDAVRCGRARVRLAAAARPRRCRPRPGWPMPWCSSATSAPHARGWIRPGRHRDADRGGQRVDDQGLRVRAQLLQAEGRMAEARASIDRAVAIIDASGSKTYTGGIAVFRVAAAMALAAGDAPAALSRIDRGATFARGDASIAGRERRPRRAPAAARAHSPRARPAIGRAAGRCRGVDAPAGDAPSRRSATPRGTGVRRDIPRITLTPTSRQRRRCHLGRRLERHGHSTALTEAYI